MEFLRRQLESIENDLKGTLGVFAQSLDGAEPVEYRAGERFPAASTVKVFVLQTLLERVAEGSLRLDDERMFTAADSVTGSGVLKSLAPQRAYTVRDLATLMIIVSDNTATNVLIELLGVDEIRATCADWGWRDTFVAGKLQVAENTEGSYTSPRDLADYFARLWRGELLPKELSEVAMTIYGEQHYTQQLGRYLSFDSYSSEVGEDSLKISSKSGSIRGVRNDAGVIENGDRRFVLAVMTKGCPDERFHVDNLGSLCVSRVAEQLYLFFGTPVPTD